SLAVLGPQQPICADREEQKVFHRLKTTIEYEVILGGVAPKPKQPCSPAITVSTFSKRTYSHPLLPHSSMRSASWAAAASAPASLPTLATNGMTMNSLRADDLGSSG